MSDPIRPNPDDLLGGIKKLAEKSSRGHLRVFFGMCPGVGKTYSMLRAAKERLHEGEDIVVGIVETHGRSETAQMLEGFEQIPRKNIQYRDTKLQEMDIDAILERKPKLVLIDELAHSNAPGSRHNKRYQDVEEILANGIDVYTTLNVQHIESRSDLVYQITEVAVQEKVPDSMLELADQIELIDISPEVLLRRLREGKVYLGERAERAAENFFKIENIIALRELALRFTAEKVDEQLRSQMVMKQISNVWNTNERLLVAVSHSPYSARLIRAARRMAYNLEAPWIAIYVDTGEELNEEDQKRLRKNLNLAKDLGAEIVHTRERSVVDALKRVAHEKNVTQIVIGRPDKRFIRDFLAQGTILEQLVQETSEIDIHVIRQERKPRLKRFQLHMLKLETGFFPYWYVLWFLIAVSFGSYALLPWIGYRAIGFIFLLAVLFVGSIAAFGPILFAAVFSAMSWNYFFIPPQFTVAIKEPEDVMNFLALFVVAFVSGYLAFRIKKQEQDLTKRARRSSVLYEFSRRLSEAKSIQEIASRASEGIAQVFGFDSVVLMKKAPGLLSDRPANVSSKTVEAKEFAVATWSLQNRKRAGWGTETLSSSRCLSVPLEGRSGMIGILLLWPLKGSQLTLEQENLLETFASNLAIGIEREIFEKKAKDAEVLESSEHLHQALLSSVSHELRTPLTAIIGNATALKNKNISEDTSRRDIIVNDLIESTERLNRVVENLLDMTRISSGALKVRDGLFEVGDFVDSTIQRASAIVKKHRLERMGSSEGMIVRGDDRLLEHVLFNLLENAAAYSPQGSLIQVLLEKTDSEAVFSVIDEGQGLNEGELEKIFERFYRVAGTPTGGTGLGLSIAKSLVEAQHGKISASNRHDRSGCIFRVSLPLAEMAPKENEILK
ncbi:MAG: sensor histidine kinase KdpD [Proteobacteria bacterium]|nr:sensor histidine kinase KdpD [Pseudomonadota bacterium]